MASTKDYADFILEQLSGLDEITARKMMGEYILYYREKVIGGIYDNRFGQTHSIGTRENAGCPVVFALRRCQGDASCRQCG